MGAAGWPVAICLRTVGLVYVFAFFKFPPLPPPPWWCEYPPRALAELSGARSMAGAFG